MNKYGVGDLVWVPAGTKTLRAPQLHDIRKQSRAWGSGNVDVMVNADGDVVVGGFNPTTKPHWGLVVEVDKCEVGGATWLSLNINNKVHHVNQKHIRKIDSKELIYDKISRSSANV